MNMKDLNQEELRMTYGGEVVEYLVNKEDGIYYGWENK